VEDTLYVDRDTSIHYRLKATHSNFKIRLREGSTPVNNALVTVHGEEAISNSLGIARFETLPTASSYGYEVKKEAYNTLEGSLFLQADTTLDLQMERLTGVNEANSSNHLKIWPNPASDLLICELPEISGSAHLILLNSCGKQMLNQTVGERQVHLSVAQLNPGMYLLLVRSENRIQKVKLLIE
jgi:hypothetical protein